MFGQSHRGSHRAVAAILAMLMLASDPAAALTAACEDPERLRFSIAAKGKPQQNLKLYLPLLDYLALRTGKPVDIFLPRSDASPLDALGDWAHLAVLSADAYVDGRVQDPAIEPFATLARGPGHLQTEAPGYQTVLISKTGGRIKKLKAAKGAALGLADGKSLLGYRVPNVVFTRLVGAELESHFSKIVYTGGHDKSTRAVLDGSVDVAFVAAKNFDRMVDKGEVLLEDVTVLWRSPPLPEGPFVYRAGLCADLKAAIADSFLTLHSDFDARHFLENLKSARMLPVGDADYQIIRDLRAAKLESDAD